MGDGDRDLVELLEVAKLKVLDATAANARATRANLAVVLRRASADHVALTSRLAARAYSLSEFLREMAWTSDPAGPASFAGKRSEFAATMDQLIFEVGVARLTPHSPAPVGPKPPQRRPNALYRAAPARPGFAAALARWLTGRQAPKPQSRPRGRILRPLLPCEIRPHA
jgi:hypothetical protein